MKTKKGFTLVELIVVISILAVLALILVPSVIGYVAKAQQAVDENNVKQLNMMTTIAATEADKEIPELFKNATNDNTRYQIIKNNAEAVLPKPAQSKKVFRFLTSINQWVCIPPGITLKNITFSSVKEDANRKIIGFHTLNGKDLIINFDDLKSEDALKVINEIAISKDKTEDITTLDNLIIENSTNFTNSNKLTIGKRSFENSTITNVSLPDYTDLGNNSFSNLVSDKVTVGNNAVLNHSSFLGATIKDMVVGSGSTVNSYAFSEQTNNKVINNLSFGENTKFSENSFYHTSKIETLTIGNNSNLSAGAIHENSKINKIVIGSDVILGTNNDGIKIGNFGTAYTSNGPGTYIYHSATKIWTKQP